MHPHGSSEPRRRPGRRAPGVRHLYPVPNPVLTRVPAGLRLRAERLERDHGAEIVPVADRWIIWFKTELVQVSAAELGDALNEADEYLASPDPDPGSG